MNHLGSWLGLAIFIISLRCEGQIDAWIAAHTREKEEKVRALKLANDEKEAALREPSAHS
jgi:hypothetical protein